jgi:uncharacterized protein YecE (DUF72 family)
MPMMMMGTKSVMINLVNLIGCVPLTNRGVRYNRLAINAASSAASVELIKECERFFEAMRPLADKTLALLIQLPPSLQILEGLQRLRDFARLDNRFRYAVEVRHRCWFQDLAYNFFVNNDICMFWSQLAEIQTPPKGTKDFLY